MDKKLQKIILGIIKENQGVVEWGTICSKVCAYYYKKCRRSLPTNTIIKHQLDLLQKEDKVIREDKIADIFYILTPLGHQEFDPFFKKVWRFLLYDKHNLFFILALIISIISLIIALTK